MLTQNFVPNELATTATATLEQLPLGWTLTHMQIDGHARVPNATHDHFTQTACHASAKTKCPVARFPPRCRLAG
jgi:hypothetical protein